MGQKLELAIGVLNGVVGDYLARTGNALATQMTLVHEGAPMPASRAGLARLPSPGPRCILFVHGLTATESCWRFTEGGDYGTRLAEELGMTALYLRYNSGRNISENGEELSLILDSLVAAYPVPVEELVLVGHSMGGLVIRAACHTATVEGHTWLPRVRRAIYLGTPHRGAPFERLGRKVASLLEGTPDPYARLVGEIGNLRSAGIKDLGDERHPIPLLASIKHHFIGGTLATVPLLGHTLGDTLVPVASAIDGCEPGELVKVMPGVGHIALANHPDVYAHLRAWCAAKLEPEKHE